jgi:putative ATPase
MPEAKIILSQATTYLATAPKSNASYLAINKATADVEGGRTLAVPEHLKNVKLRTADGAPSAAYVYPHDYEGHVVDQDYVPTTSRYYEPSAQGYEETIGKRLDRWREQRREAGATPPRKTRAKQSRRRASGAGG